jgi:hypothetical protein
MKKETKKTLPRVIGDNNPPTFLVEDWEIDNLADFPKDLKMPFSGFTDEDGKTHFELNVWGWTPEFSRKKGYYWMLHPDKFLDEFFDRITATSLVKKERKIVAAMAGMYHGAEKKAVIHYFATRPRSLNDLPEGHEVRVRALPILVEHMERLLRWLGAETGETSPCVIPVEKMKKIGWLVKPIGIIEKMKVFRRGFPVSIRRKARIFIKYFKSATPAEVAPDNLHKSDRNAA